MTKKTINKPQEALPYQDIKTPFSVDEKGAFAEYIVGDPQQMQNIALGATILISDYRHDDTIFWFSGRIVGLRSIAPFNPERENLLYQENDDYNPQLITQIVGGPHNHQPMIISVALDAELDKNGSDFSLSPIQRPPSVKSRLFFPSLNSEVADQSPSLQDILNIRKNGICLGLVGSGNRPHQDQDGNFLEYLWDIQDLDNKHTFIVGESGSGKTVFLKNLAYEIRHGHPNNRVILTDVQGDIIQLLFPELVNELPIKKPWQQKARDRDKELSNLSQDSIFESLSPFQLVMPITKNQELSPVALKLKELCKKKDIPFTEIGLRLRDLSDLSEVEYLFRVMSPQVLMLLDDIFISLKKRNQPLTIKSISQFITQKLKEHGDSQSAGGKKPDYIENNNGVPYYVRTFDAARRALRSLEDYFDYHQTSDGEFPPLDCLKFNGTSILYLDDLNQDQKIMYEMQMVKWLYENKKDIEDTFVFIDEAHQIIPSKQMGSGSNETFERLRANFDRLAREGRKYRVNLILSTQSPKDLHEIVPDMCPNRVVMKINPKNAQYSFLEPGLAVIANRFSHGEFWFQSPFNGTPNWLRIHSKSNPLPHEPMNLFWKKLQGD